MIKHGEVWDALQCVVDQRKADVIVAGTRGRRGLSKLVMGSVAEEILRLSPVPVLTVPPTAQSRLSEIRNILYPTDFSVDSLCALAHALSLAHKFRSCLILLHVAHRIHDDTELRNRLQGFLSEQERQIAPGETKPWCQQELVVEFGDPTARILDCAESYKADLIVMGVRGAGAMARAATHFGSTAYRIISEAHAPVLSVRAFGEQALS
jgi:nucleotide-binding universal stress UspA family protein